MDGYVYAEKKAGGNSKVEKFQSAKKSLNNYVNQLQMHFDLNEDELYDLLVLISKTRKNNDFEKKWWHIWK